MFDLRVTEDDQKKIWTHHNLIWCIPLQTVLETVREFVDRLVCSFYLKLCIIGCYIKNEFLGNLTFKLIYIGKICSDVIDYVRKLMD